MQNHGKSLHVIIVGGGVGGLCLAQGLKKSGVNATVYERDKSADFRRQGYRIHIDPNGSHALAECLPENLYELCVATSNQFGKQVSGFDHNLNEIFVMPVKQSESGDPTRVHLAVNRLTMREVLLAGLGGNVQFGKVFTGYEQAHEGRVRVVFADGTTAEGDILVGADGANSMIRETFLPGSTLVDTGFRCIYGKTLITEDSMRWIPPTLFAGFTGVAGPDRRTMAIGGYRKREDFESAVSRLAPYVRLTLAPDYLMWALVLPLTQLPENVDCCDPAKLHAIVVEKIADWHPDLRRLVADADIPAMFLIPIRSSNKPAQWQTGNVTLLGDAIHTMPPAGGVGANTALRDAELLRKCLVDAAEGRVSLTESVRRYETEMLRYGFEAVENSMKAAAQFFRGSEKEFSGGQGQVK